VIPDSNDISRQVTSLSGHVVIKIHTALLIAR